MKKRKIFALFLAYLIFLLYLCSGKTRYVSSDLHSDDSLPIIEVMADRAMMNLVK